MEKAYLAEDVFGLVVTEGSKEISRMARSGTSVIIEGAKGCGKTATLELVDVDLFERGYLSFPVFAPATFKEFYHSIYRSMLSQFPGTDIIENVEELFFKQGYLDSVPIKHPDQMLSERMCAFPQCYKPKRCKLAGPTGNNIFEIIEHLPREINCPLYQWIIIKAVEFLNRELGKRLIFLLDMPDNLLEVDIRYVTNFMQEFRKASLSTIILMATREQYVKLGRNEYFKRWMRLDFVKLTGKELKKIVNMRIEECSAKDKEYIFPFNENVLNYLIGKCNWNPRWLLQSLNFLLSWMSDMGMEAPVDIEIAKEVLDKKKITSLSQMDAIELMLQEYRERGGGWVYVKIMVEDIFNKYHIKISYARLGRLLKFHYRFDQRYNPTSQYFIR